MFNFDFLVKGPGLVSPPHFFYNILRKFFLIYILLRDQISLPLLLEISGNMCMVIIWFPVGGIIDFEINLSFLIWLFSYMTNLNIFRKKSVSKVINSRPEVFCKKGVLRNFAKFVGKHLCQNLFFNKVAGLRPATLLKKRFWHRSFPVNFAKYLRTAFFIASVR